jgi:glycosyltransferase involved in cell wall biosynthesis
MHAGIPDVIIHNQTGLLCDEHDYNKMAEHMIWVAEHPDEAIKMGKAGRENIKDNFSMERHIGQLNDLIEKVSHG